MGRQHSGQDARYAYVGSRYNKVTLGQLKLRKRKKKKKEIKKGTKIEKKEKWKNGDKKRRHT